MKKRKPRPNPKPYAFQPSRRLFPAPDDSDWDAYLKGVARNVMSEFEVVDAGGCAPGVIARKRAE